GRRRTVPIIGLIFLCVYMMPVSLLAGDVNPLAFIPGALGFVFLLGATERQHAMAWGHHIPDDDNAVWLPAASRGRGLATTGRRAGLGAIACAVVVPIFIPTLSPHLLDESG